MNNIIINKNNNNNIMKQNKNKNIININEKFNKWLRKLD